jgi:hypothetical protein
MQSIAFAQAGPVDVLLGSTTNNPATGGAGSGAVTYSSSNTNAVTVDSAGIATAVGVGTAVITATKAADTNYAQAQASYTINVLTAVKIAQTIAFTNPGPISGAVGTTVTNAASGGQGLGAITYASSNTTAGTVSSTTGVVTLTAVGTTTITATKAADSAYAAATAAYTINVTQGVQSIAFAQGGPLNVLLGATTNNPATGGAGSGTVSYSSSNTNAVTVDSTGAAIAVGVGTSVITATKAADTNYVQAQASYTINAQTTGKVGAFIGASSTEVNLPASANGKQFVRARVADCAATDVVPNCANAQLSPVNGAPITDTTATLTAPAYYAIVNGSTPGTPVDVRVGRFTDRVGHSVAWFNNRYWVIGGAEPVFPVVGGPANLQYTLKSDVWSSADGKSWKLETPDAGFAPRWYHNTVVFNNRIWVISGERIPPATPIFYSDVWSSADGVTWRQETADANLPWHGASCNIVVFNNQMLAVSGAQTLTSTNGVFAPLPTGGILLGIALSGAGRQFSTLTIYNNQLWFIAGRVHYPLNQPDIGGATNDVYNSADGGVTWTQVTANAAFSPRYEHSSFVANGKLWVLGGQGATAGTPGPPSNDAWSTTDGLTWTQENVSNLAGGYLMPVVQETGKVTLFGGLQGAFANNVWQTTDGLSWSELSTDAPFSPRLTTGTEFNGQMWVIGGQGTRDSSGTNVRNDVWRSSDGLNWSPVTPAGSIFSRRAGHAVVVFNNRLWVIGGGDNVAAAGGPSVRLNDVWSSSDGVSWTQQTPAGGTIFSPRMFHAAVVYAGKLWIIGGDVASGTPTDTYANDVWYTTDGTTWVNASANGAFPAREGHSVAVLNGSMWLIGGDNSSGALADGWSSPDGVTWTQQLPNSTSFPARTTHAAAVLNGRLYVVGGAAGTAYGVTQYNDVWSTADGTNWRMDTGAAAFSARSMFAMFVHNNEIWLSGGFAAGLFNDVWRSSDAVNWRVAFSDEIAAP